MHKISSAALLALALSLPSFAAQASIVGTASGLSTFDTYIDFSSPTLANDTVVSNQFAGLTIAPLAGGQVRYDSCGAGNLAAFAGGTQNYIDNYGPGCATNTTDDSFSIKFSNNLQALSFAGELNSAVSPPAISLLRCFWPGLCKTPRCSPTSISSVTSPPAA